MGLLSASLRVLGETRALDVAIIDGAGAHVTGFDASRPATSSITSVATSTTSATLLAANTARRQFYIYNDSGSNLFVAFAATATATAFTVLIPKNGFFASEMNGYTGVISGILSSGTGNARLTEVTT
jgi:hypothetical protein